MNYSRYAGASLIEVLVVLIILSVISLAVNVASVQSIKTNRDAYYRTLALSFTNSFIQRISYISDIDLYTYNLEVKEWQNSIKNSLPNGAAMINPQNNKIEYLVSWNYIKHDTSQISIKVYPKHFNMQLGK